MKKDLLKKVAAAVLAATLAIGGTVTVPQFANVARAAASNTSMATAQEVVAGTVAQGLIEKNETTRERWYKYTNNTGSDAVAKVTITGNNDWSHYHFFDNSGVGEGEDGIVTGLSKVFYLGVNKGEAGYLKIDNDSIKDIAGFSISVSFTAEETNGFNGLKKIKSGKAIYGKLDYKKDVDTYKIKAKKSGKMIVKVTNNGIDGTFAELEYKVCNKSRAAKASGRLRISKTGKAKIKVKKGQCIYVQVKGHDLGDNSLGDYVITTKIKK